MSEISILTSILLIGMSIGLIGLLSIILILDKINSRFERIYNGDRVIKVKQEGRK